jgi:prepilin-type N-terminal cleavage/methylation domain-containing protein
MFKKNSAFSLMELIVVMAIVAILATISYPSYKSHVVKIKTAEIFTTMSYYKIYLADALANNETIHESYTNPSNLIAKLSLQAIDTNTTYIIQATVNTEQLHIKQLSEKPLLINLIGTLQNEALTWQCQLQAGYNINTTEPCQIMELTPLS